MVLGGTAGAVVVVSAAVVAGGMAGGLGRGFALMAGEVKVEVVRALGVGWVDWESVWIMTDRRVG